MNGAEENCIKEALKEYWRPLIQFTYQYIDDWTESEDIVQSAFNVLLEYPCTSCQKRWGYLCGICKNKSLTLLRKRRKLVYSEMETEAETLPSDNPDPFQTLDYAQAIEILNQGIEEVLSDTERAIFLYRFKEGLPPKTIAEKLAISEGNVYTRFSEAKKKLTEYLNSKMES